MIATPKTLLEERLMCIQQHYPKGHRKCIRFTMEKQLLIVCSLLSSQIKIVYKIGFHYSFQLGVMSACLKTKVCLQKESNVLSIISMDSVLNCIMEYETCEFHMTSSVESLFKRSVRGTRSSGLVIATLIVLSTLGRQLVIQRQSFGTNSVV